MIAQILEVDPWRAWRVRAESRLSDTRANCFHGFSMFYCMTTSLSHGGAGLGTLGFHEPKVRELCAEAGFGSVRRVPLENPFNNLYEIRP